MFVEQLSPMLSSGIVIPGISDANTATWDAARSTTFIEMQKAMTNNKMNFFILTGNLIPVGD